MQNTDKFAIEVIARGSYLDEVPDVGGESVYKVEAITMRLNQTALNEWILSEDFNTRDCYVTEEEYQAHKKEYKEKRLLWEAKMKAALGYENHVSVSITQAMSEVFTAVHIWKV